MRFCDGVYVSGVYVWVCVRVWGGSRGASWHEFCSTTVCICRVCTSECVCGCAGGASWHEFCSTTVCMCRVCTSGCVCGCAGDVWGAGWHEFCSTTVCMCWVCTSECACGCVGGSWGAGWHEFGVHFVLRAPVSGQQRFHARHCGQGASGHRHGRRVRERLQEILCHSVKISEKLCIVRWKLWEEILRCSVKFSWNSVLFSENSRNCALFSDTLACRVGITRQAKYLAGKMWISVLARHDENTRWNFDKLIAELFVGFGQLLLVFLCLFCSSITDVFMNEWYSHLWFIAADEFSISSQYSSPSCMYTRNRQDWQ